MIDLATAAVEAALAAGARYADARVMVVRHETMAARNGVRPPADESPHEELTHGRPARDRTCTGRPWTNG